MKMKLGSSVNPSREVGLSEVLLAIADSSTDGEKPLRGDRVDQCQTDPGLQSSAKAVRATINANTALVRCPLAVQ
jgi:hypothetical protein